MLNLVQIYFIFKIDFNKLYSKMKFYCLIVFVSWTSLNTILVVKYLHRKQLIEDRHSVLELLLCSRYIIIFNLSLVSNGECQFTYYNLIF